MNLPELKITVTKKEEVEKEFKITSPKSAYVFFGEIFNADTINWVEEVCMILLNNAKKVIGFYKISKGGVAASIVDPKVIFTVALISGASGIILAHNHPSENLAPSEADKKITNKLIEGGKILSISILDHLIITKDSYFSFADEGII